MLKSVPAAAAALLLSLSPALAATQPRDVSKNEAPGKAQIQDQVPTADSTAQASDDDIQIIIMGKSMQVEVPNPYANPKPRMITDAWAMRA
jgi:hypothetical protein